MEIVKSLVETKCDSPGNDGEANRILDMDFEKEKEKKPLDDLKVILADDSPDVLMAIAQGFISGETSGKAKVFVKALCNERSLGELFRGGERVWVDASMINSVFQTSVWANVRGEFAWYLSQDKNSKYYGGQWFDKRGILVRQGTRFRARQYRISDQALSVIGWLMSKGFVTESF